MTTALYLRRVCNRCSAHGEHKLVRTRTPVQYACASCGHLHEQQHPDELAPDATAQVDAAVERARAEREPLPPAVLVDALQDRAHVSSGVGRAARSVKVPSNGTPQPMPADAMLTAPIEQVDAELREMGIDPVELGKRGAAFAAEQIAKRQLERHAHELDERRAMEGGKRSNGTPQPMPAVHPPRELHGLVGAAVDAIREREANDLQQLRARFGETAAALEDCQAGHAREVERADAAEKRAQEAEQERDALEDRCDAQRTRAKDAERGRNEAEQRHRKSDWAREETRKQLLLERERADAAERKLRLLCATIETFALGWRVSGEYPSITSMLDELRRQARETGAPKPGKYDPAPGSMLDDSGYPYGPEDERETGAQETPGREALADRAAEAVATPAPGEEKQGPPSGEALTAEQVVSKARAVRSQVVTYVASYDDAIALVERFAREQGAIALSFDGADATRANMQREIDRVAEESRKFERAWASATQDREQQLAERDAEIAQLKEDVAFAAEEAAIYLADRNRLQDARAQPRDGALREAARALMDDAWGRAGVELPISLTAQLETLYAALAVEPQPAPADNSRDAAVKALTGSAILVAAADAVQERKHVCAGMALMGERDFDARRSTRAFWRHVADELQRAEDDLRARSLALRGGR